MLMAVVVALLLQAIQPPPPRPLFPLRVHAVFRVDMRGAAYAAYRQRLSRAISANAGSPVTDFRINSPLFPDPTREGAAYAALSFPPQLRVFLVRNPSASKLPVEDQDPDVSFILKNTAADPPVPAGERPITRPPVDKKYSFSRDFVFIDVPMETLTKADYAEGAAIVSDRDLLNTQITLTMSSYFTLQSFAFEFGGVEIRLRPEDFKQSVGRRDNPVYSLRFPETQEAFSRLVTR